MRANFRRRASKRQLGVHHNLESLYQKVRSTHFADFPIDCIVRWGRLPAPAKKPRNSVRLGGYIVETRTVTVHPVLDQVWVPSLFVEFILYHEMLHQKHDIPVVAGRNVYHTDAFRADEKRFPQFAEMIKWECDNLNRLLRSY